MPRPIRLSNRAPVLIEDCSSGANWTASGGTENAPSSVTLPDGTTGTRVTYSGQANTNLFLTCTRSFNFAGRHGVELDVYLMPATTTTVQGYDADVRIRNAGNTNSWIANIVLTPGWNKVRLSRGDFTVLAGAPNWDSTTFVDCLLKVNAVASMTPYVIVSNLSYAGYSRPQFAVVFDDNWANQYSAALPIMSPLGIPGTIATNLASLDTASHLTAAQLRELHDTYKWAVCNHTYDHSFVQDSGYDACLAAITTQRDMLIAQGYTRDDEHKVFLSPGGLWSEPYLAAAIAAGCNSFWGTGPANSGQPASVCGGDPLPVVHTGQTVLPRCFAINNAATGAQGVAFIDSCVKAGKSAVLSFHRIETPATTVEMTTVAAFTSMMQRLYQMRAMVDVVTLPQFVQRLRAPTL